MAEIAMAETPAWRHWTVVAGLGAAMGLLYAVLMWIIGRYVTDPLMCGTGDAGQCLQSTSMAGNVATVLVAIAGTVLAIRLEIVRPLLVAIGAAALLWGLGDWTAGLFWLETLGWAMLLYALAYAFFVWLSRYALLPVIIAVAVVIVAAEHILLALL